MRIASKRSLKNGGWLHPTVATELDAAMTIGSRAEVPLSECAPVEARDRAYRALVRALGLSPAHRTHLVDRRGLPEEALRGFASAPSGHPRERRRIAKLIQESLGDPDRLRGVPGFYLDRFGRWTLAWLPEGFLVPVLDDAGRLQALQHRADAPRPEQPRYTWLSSRTKPAGCSPGAPAGFARPELAEREALWITEGALKARVSAWHLSIPVLGISGVATWRRALSLIPENVPVVVAFDSDFRTNAVVARHRRDFASALFWRRHAVSLAEWNPEFKGLDDAALANVRIERRAWPTRSTHAARDRSQRLPSPTHRAAARIAEVVR